MVTEVSVITPIRGARERAKLTGEIAGLSAILNQPPTVSVLP
jgi:hypothetical protein